MNGSLEHLRIDQGHLESLLKQGLITTKVFNMLIKSKIGCEEGKEEDDRRSRLPPKKKSKAAKNCESSVPLTADSTLQNAVVDTSEVPEAESNEAWDVLPSPPTRLREHEGEDTRSAEDERGGGPNESHEVKQVEGAGWAFTWCFRCQREDVLKFSGKALPEWLVTSLNFKGDKAEPIVLSICCTGCNNKHRPASVSVGEEEKKIRQAFETLRINCDSLGREAVGVAKARAGRDVRMIRWGGRAGSVDVEMIKQNLSPEDIAVSISLEAFREGKQGGELELGGLAGGLF